MTYRLLILIAGAVLFLNSCHKDNGNVPTGTLQFHLHTYVGTTEVDAYNVVYTTDAGRKISLSIAQFYLSGIQVEREDGSLYTIPDTLVLKTLDREAYLVAKIPVGNYKSVRFRIGLDSVTNTRVPSTSTGDVLNHPEMWFGSTAQPEGYVFLNCQGKIDTTNDASGLEADMQPFIYKIGTTQHYIPVVMPNEPFAILADRSQFAHMYADVSKLFNGVQLNNPANLSVNSVAGNTSTVANTVSGNIASMFIYE